MKSLCRKQSEIHKHPLINPSIFLGDATFDTLTVYRDLLTSDAFGTNKHSSYAYIPLNKHSSLADTASFINEDGIPCYPDNSPLCCKKRFIYHCENPCTSFVSGRMVCIYPEKISICTPMLSEEQKAETTLTKYEPSSKKIIITSKKISALPNVVHKTKKYYTRI